MENVTKLYVNLTTGEISAEGSEAFVTGQMDNIKNLISLVRDKAISPQDSGHENTNSEEANIDTQGNGGDVGAAPQAKTGEIVVPDVFGEWLHQFKGETSDQDKALITAYYVQQSSAENDFKTSEINKSLIDHGIKLTNTSTTLKQLEQKKFLIQIRKVGRLSYKRVSPEGTKYLKSIMNESS